MTALRHHDQWLHGIQETTAWRRASAKVLAWERSHKPDMGFVEPLYPALLDDCAFSFFYHADDDQSPFEEEDSDYESGRRAAINAARRLRVFVANPRAQAACELTGLHWRQTVSHLEKLEVALESTRGLEIGRRLVRAETDYHRHHVGCLLFKSDRTGRKPPSVETMLAFALAFRVRTWANSRGRIIDGGPMPAKCSCRTPWTAIAAMVTATFPRSEIRFDRRAAEKEVTRLAARHPDLEYFGWPPKPPEKTSP